MLLLDEVVWTFRQLLQVTIKNFLLLHSIFLLLGRDLKYDRTGRTHELTKREREKKGGCVYGL